MVHGGQLAVDVECGFVVVGGGELAVEGLLRRVAEDEGEEGGEDEEEDPVEEVLHCLGFFVQGGGWGGEGRGGLFGDSW